MKRVTGWIFCVLGLLFPASLLCQSDTGRIARDSTTLNSPVTPADSLPSARQERSLQATEGVAATASRDTVLSRPRKSALLAVGLSAAAPGLGQIYYGNYWKPPIILGLGAYWVSEWIKLDRRYSDYAGLYRQSIERPDPSLNPSTLLSLRDSYRDERDKFAWYLGALYLLNLVDAYVGANLYDFDVGSDLGLNGRMLPKASATIRLRF